MKKTRGIESQIKERLLSKFFLFEGKVATLKLVYDTFSELVNPNFGDYSTEKLNDKLFSDIKEAIEILPRGYKVNIEIIIKDFGEYKREECEEIILMNIKLFIYSALKSWRKHLGYGLALVGIGAAVLIASYFLHSSDYDILFDIVNISGTLCVWEGVNTAFIERKLEKKTTKKIAKTIQKIDVIGN